MFPALVDDLDPRGARRLAADVIIQAVKDALDMSLVSEPYLAMAFESPEMRRMLEIAGLGHLADLPSDELARLALQHAPTVLDGSRRCANCIHARASGNGLVRCVLGVWDERAGSSGVEYAETTVQNSSREMFRACDHFERRME
ncbi:MAG TPA: hypothetical protein EYH32_04960 [Anaerolineae bacterium]|nr:hypothetical protein [Anaerolineae bacterium]